MGLHHPHVDHGLWAEHHSVFSPQVQNNLSAEVSPGLQHFSPLKVPPLPLTFVSFPQIA